MSETISKTKPIFTYTTDEDEGFMIIHSERELSKLEAQGLIKAFELVHELSWLTIKDYYQGQGDVSIQGSKDAFRLAFKRGLIKNQEKQFLFKFGVEPDGNQVLQGKI